MTDPTQPNNQEAAEGSQDSRPQESPPDPSSEPNGNPEAETDGNANIPENAAPLFEWGDGLDLHITNDKLLAKLEASVEHGQQYKADDLERFARAGNVKIDFENDVFNKIIRKKIYNEPVIIARGRPPQNGRDGYVDWKINLSVLDGAALNEKGGRVDWKESTHVLPVKANDLLAILVEPENGVDGKNVHGETLESKPGKEAKLPAGKGVRVNETGTEMFADIDGVVCREGDKYSVSQTLDITSDVSFETGNLDYEGTVIIKGGILSDFIVKSGQDLHVEGLVEGAQLIAAGNIYMSGGIQGDNKAHIQAGGDITVKYINNARVEAKGDIIVNSSVSQSVLRSFKSIRVEGNKAVIAGGHIFAEHEIEAGVLGAEIGTKTIISIGAELLKLKDKSLEGEKKLHSLDENRKKLEQATGQLNILRDKGKITPKHEELRLKITRTLMQLKGQIKTLQNDIKTIALEFQMGKEKQKGIIAKEMAYPGVLIEIMGQKHPVKTPKSKILFAMPDNEIAEYGYKPKEEQKAKKEERE